MNPYLEAALKLLRWVRDKAKIGEKAQFTWEQMSILSRFLTPYGASWGIGPITQFYTTVVSKRAKNRVPASLEAIQSLWRVKQTPANLISPILKQLLNYKPAP